MNVELFRSRHVVVGATLAALIVVASMIDDRARLAPGETSRMFRLASGWLAVVTFLAVGAYALRKYAHRGGYSPEFLVRTDYAKIDKATRDIKRLAAEIVAGSDSQMKSISKRASALIREAGAHRVLRARVRRDSAGLAIDLVPTEPLGRVARWLGAHIGYGGLFGVAVLLHGGSLGYSPLGKGLLLLSGVVVVSGAIGAFVWAAGPRWMTSKEKDLSIEEAFALRKSLKNKLADGRATLDGTTRAKFDKSKSAADLGGSDVAMELRDLFVLREQLTRVRRVAHELGRVRWAMVGWKLVHVPAVVMLTALVAVHVVMIWSY